MGLDFIRRATKTFIKTWNRGASQLARPTLFTRYPECRTRSVIATLNEQVNIPNGVQLTVHAEAKRLVLVREIHRVGLVEIPPADLFKAIQESGGCANARITRVNPLSGTADVEIE